MPVVSIPLESSNDRQSQSHNCNLQQSTKPFPDKRNSLMKTNRHQTVIPQETIAQINTQIDAISAKIGGRRARPMTPRYPRVLPPLFFRGYSRLCPDKPRAVHERDGRSSRTWSEKFRTWRETSMLRCRGSTGSPGTPGRFFGDVRDVPCQRPAISLPGRTGWQGRGIKFCVIAGR
jgi:hypothetical protein